MKKTIVFTLLLVLMCFAFLLAGCNNIGNESPITIQENTDIPHDNEEKPDGYISCSELVYPSQTAYKEMNIVAPNGDKLLLSGTWDKIIEIQSGADNEEDNFEKYYQTDSSKKYHMLIDFSHEDTCVIQHSNLDDTTYDKTEFKYIVKDNQIIGFYAAGYTWLLEIVNEHGAQFNVRAIDSSDDQYGIAFKRTIILKKIPRAEVRVYSESTGSKTVEVELLRHMIWIETATFDENNIFNGILSADGELIMEGMPVVTPEKIKEIEYNGNVMMNIYNAKGKDINLKGESGDSLMYSGAVTELPTEKGDYIICFRLYDDMAVGKSHDRMYFIYMIT